MTEHRIIFWKTGHIREAVGGTVRVEQGRETDELLSLLRNYRITAYDALTINRKVHALEEFRCEDDLTQNPQAIRQTLSTILARYERIVQHHQEEWHIVRQEQEDARYPGWGFTVLERRTS